MKKLIAALALTLMAACTTQQNTAQTFTKACTAYDAAFSTALAARKAGKLSPGQIDAITTVTHQITPLCTGPMPTDPVAATEQVTKAVTTLTVLEVQK